MRRNDTFERLYCLHIPRNTVNTASEPHTHSVFALANNRYAWRARGLQQKKMPNHADWMTLVIQPCTCTNSTRLRAPSQTHRLRLVSKTSGIRRICWTWARRRAALTRRQHSKQALTNSWEPHVGNPFQTSEHTRATAPAETPAEDCLPLAAGKTGNPAELLLAHLSGFQNLNDQLPTENINDPRRAAALAPLHGVTRILLP